MKIPTIFLDTNIFITENFFASERINEFFRLGEESKVRLITTPITIIEIKTNFKRRVKVAIELVGQFRKNRASAVLKNLKVGKELLSISLHENKLIQEFNEEFESKIIKGNVQIVPYAEINVEHIFNDYELGSPPFNTSDKKSEFPDAIAIKLLENWCKKQNEDCIIFTQDKAFWEYKHPNLKIHNDYKAYLSNILFAEVMDESLESLIQKFESQEDGLKLVIQQWIKGQLYDNDKYYNVVNWMKVHSIKIGKIETDFLPRDGEGGLFITSVHEEKIRLEIIATCYFIVDIEIDDENSSIYDLEDKEIMYLDTTTRTEFIPITFEYPLYDEDYESELEIVKINYGKSLELKNDYANRR